MKQPAKTPPSGSGSLPAAGRRRGGPGPWRSPRALSPSGVRGFRGRSRADVPGTPLPRVRDTGSASRQGEAPRNPCRPGLPPACRRSRPERGIPRQGRGLAAYRSRVPADRRSLQGPGPADAFRRRRRPHPREPRHRPARGPQPPGPQYPCARNGAEVSWQPRIRNVRAASRGPGARCLLGSPRPLPGLSRPCPGLAESPGKGQEPPDDGGGPAPREAATPPVPAPRQPERRRGQPPRPPARPAPPGPIQGILRRRRRDRRSRTDAPRAGGNRGRARLRRVTPPAPAGPARPCAREGRSLRPRVRNAPPGQGRAGIRPRRGTRPAGRSPGQTLTFRIRRL
jgi:hypothetical protein